MGQFLDKPNTEKNSHSETFGADISYGLSSMQGWRIHMEDAHTHVTHIPGLNDTAFFAVFDGHGGKTVAQEGAQSIIKCIMNTEKLKTASDKTKPDVLAEAIRQGLFDLDEEIKAAHEELRQGHDRSGATVVTMFLTPTHFIFGNCGDSRVVLASNNQVKFASEDHKPMNEGERERVRKAGGFVEMGRVCGNLAVSRALGDYEYKDRQDLPKKDQKITCDADLTIIERTAQDNFIVLACDGIWDVCTNRQVVVFVNFYLERGYNAVQIAEALLDFCLDRGSKDNMSALVILLPAATKAKSQIPSAETDEQKSQRIAAEKKQLAEELAKLPQEGDIPPPPTDSK
eukprot:m.20516 g.20516  ORF g.20516 m.20516 type:complete len:343 (-) comp8904_c0_seq1:643-1671(-)